MSAQLSIDDISAKRTGGDYMLQARAWIEANPVAWDYIVSQAETAAARGHRFGMKALWEVVRWHFKVIEGREYHCNNNLTSPLARILIEQRPHLRPFVELRGSRFDAPRKTA